MSQRANVVSPLESTVSVGKLNSSTMTREAHLSSQLHSALIPAIRLEGFPKCAITVQVTILQAVLYSIITDMLGNSLQPKSCIRFDEADGCDVNLAWLRLSRLSRGFVAKNLRLCQELGSSWVVFKT